MSSSGATLAIDPCSSGVNPRLTHGVPQRADLDFEVEGRTLVFQRQLRKDRISGWRWFLGAWGVGTYRQDDTVDVRYEVDGEARVARALAIVTSDDDPTVA
jgi:hypothetical protein